MKNIATWIRPCDVADFSRTFAPFAEVRLWDAQAEQVPWEEIDALLLTGGGDITPEFLRQPVPDPQVIEEPEPTRDVWEFDVVEKALRQRLPIFAICRGLQVLNVALGGTLHLDIPGHDDAARANIQELRYVAPVPFAFPLVNSSHHQALDRLGRGLVVEAQCAADGVIERARLDDYPFGLGVQYHPERDALYAPLFEAFVAAIKTGRA